jgi:hypothetical protein
VEVASLWRFFVFQHAGRLMRYFPTQRERKRLAAFGDDFLRALAHYGNPAPLQETREGRRKGLRAFARLERRVFLL